MNSIESSFKRKVAVIVTSVFFISLIVVSVSYSSFSNIGTETNNYVVDDYPITTIFKNDDIISATLDPINNASEFNGEIKSLSVTNNSDLDVLYYILLENLDKKNVENNIQISIDDGNAVVLADLPIKDGKRVINSGIVKKRNEVNDVMTHNIKLSSINGKEKVTYRISVLSEVANDVAVDILKTLSKSSSVTSVDSKLNSGILEDAYGNIRYFGEKPNNYIMFNDEMWRIVGVFDVLKSDGRKESRIKIVKDECIGSSKFILDSKMDWNMNIGKFLNQYEIKNIKKDYADLYDYVIYNVGGLTNISNYKASDFYDNEISENDLLGRESSIASGLGLLTISDYYYASSDGVSGNWLKSNNSYWLMNNNSKDVNKAFYVDTNGVVSEDYVSSIHNVKPVVYLKSVVRFVNGDGSLNNPYVIE